MVELEVAVFIGLFVIAAIAAYYKNRQRAMNRGISASQVTVPKPRIKATQPTTPSLSASISSASKKPVIPEDSMLRRHFITELRNQIESSHQPRPTDSTLLRHYLAMIESELNSCLN